MTQATPEALNITVTQTVTRTRHIPALDGLRGLAVFIVFMFHYGGGTHSSNHAVQAFGFINKGGWSGVTLFFVLSGFLITGILWDSFADAHWWRKFFARRSLRIFPLYFLALVLVVLAAIPGGTMRLVLHHIWIPVFFLENFPHLAQISDNLPSPLPIFHLWSIAVEEQFYLVWPFLLVIQKTRAHAKYLCLFTFFGSCLFRTVIWSRTGDPVLWEHFILTQAGALALGGWLALSYRGPEWPRIVRLASMFGVVGLVGFLVSGIFSRDFTTQGHFMMTWGLPCVSVFFASVLALSVEPGLIAKLVSFKPLRWLGNISFGVYVFHMLLLPVITHVAQAVAGNRSRTAFLVTQFVVAGTLSIVAALLSFHLYEKQFLKLKKYFVPRTQARADASLATAKP